MVAPQRLATFVTSVTRPDSEPKSNGTPERSLARCENQPPEMEDAAAAVKVEAEEEEEAAMVVVASVTIVAKWRRVAKIIKGKDLKI